MQLPSVIGNFWTHKSVVSYSQLNSGAPDVMQQFSITAVTQSGYQLNAPTAINLTGMTATVIAGTGIGHTAVVSSYIPESTTETDTNLTRKIAFLPDFSPRLDTTSIIQFTMYYSYRDIMLFGIPANHIITGVKVSVLSSFLAGSIGSNPNSVWVYISNYRPLLLPLSYGQSLITDVTETYGMGNLTIPAGTGDAYEYGSFNWFTFSAPGSTTFARNPSYSSSTLGSYCLPQRLDAHDIFARFCIIPYGYSPGSPSLLNNVPINNLTDGSVELSVQYAPIGAAKQVQQILFQVSSGTSYIVARHSANNSFVNSVSPAAPGETIFVYVYGFDPVNLPVVTIGGNVATVTYAGQGTLPAGQVQITLVVPPMSSNGDLSIVATYDQMTTQSGTLLTVHN